MNTCGIPPTWCSSDKDLVGTAMGPARLWYTLGHGILNEVYYPRIDIPQIRDLGFIVTDNAGFWVEVKRWSQPEITTPAPGVPLPTVRHQHPRFTLTLRLCPDPERDVLRLEVDLQGDAELQPVLLLAPRLGGSGLDNRAWVDCHRGRRVLWAEQGPFGLALLATDPQMGDAFGLASAGCVGVSDAWQDFARHGSLQTITSAAGPGNVSLAAFLPRRVSLALGLASSKEAAATLAWSSLVQPFDTLVAQQTAAWESWHTTRESWCTAPPLPPPLLPQWRHSAQVLKTLADKTFLGAMVASLSVPWGNQGEERGGYHLVWPRDLVECAWAWLALGGVDEARASLGYLIATQNEDGGWWQNQWLGGKPYWQGVQLDEAAFPVLLAAALSEHAMLDGLPVEDMVRRALAYLMREGPASPQDRWEEDAGVNPFTVAAAIAALVAGAELLPRAERPLPLLFADYWNARLEHWCVARQTPLAAAHGVEAYYVREAPVAVLESPGALQRRLPIKNRSEDPQLPASAQVGLEFLALVRLGLRRGDDPIIRDSVKVADALLRVETPDGPVWHRYNGDGYGEHEDGRPFDGTGQGRGWPLLTGERGHYALDAGEDPLPYLEAMNAMAGRQAVAGQPGLIPEQVWDTEALPDKGLYPGRPSGSAMPLAWAHAEWVKLAAARALGHPTERLNSVWQRYAGKRPDPDTWVWTPGAPLPAIPPDKTLLLVFPGEAVLHFGFDGWQQVAELSTLPAGLGMHSLRLEASRLSGHGRLDFTWRDAQGWSGHDESIQITQDLWPD